MNWLSKIYRLPHGLHFYSTRSMTSRYVMRIILVRATRSSSMTAITSYCRIWILEVCCLLVSSRSVIVTASLSVTMSWNATLSAYTSGYLHTIFSSTAWIWWRGNTPTTTICLTIVLKFIGFFGSKKLWELQLHSLFSIWDSVIFCLGTVP